MQISRLLHSKTPEFGTRRSRCRVGATTLETALVMGTWTMVFVGIFDAGVTTMRSNTASHLARQAARMTIVRGSQAGPELPVWGPTTRIVNLADASEISRTLAPHLRGLNASAFNLKLEWLDGNNDPDSRVRATVTSAYSPVLTKLTGLGSIPMQAQCTMSIVH